MNKEQNTSFSGSPFAVMALEYVETASLKTLSRKLRRHSESKLRRLSEFMKKSGVITPLVVNKDNFVVLGNARLAALKLLGVESVPVIRVTHLDDSMIRALILADNQFTLNANWYEEALREELLYLAPLMPDIGLELIDLGFETPQLDLIIGDADTNDAGEEEEPILEAPPVTQPGQLWLLGPHKLFCGDAREEASYSRLMGTERAAMIFGDVPYNVPIKGHVCGNGRHQHKEFVMGAGEMSTEQFISFMKEIFVLLRRFSVKNSVHMQCMDWRHSLEILTAAQQAGYDYLNMACWVKHAGGMGSLYRSQHELVHIFRSGTGAHINNVMLGKFGRNRTNVWQYDGANSFSRREELALHSTAKPIEMVADAIKDCSNRGDFILDPTAGAGSTLMAAQRTERIARLIELDPHYCDVIIRRWQKATGQQAILSSSNRSFDDIAAEISHV